MRRIEREMRHLSKLSRISVPQKMQHLPLFKLHDTPALLSMASRMDALIYANGSCVRASLNDVSIILGDAKSLDDDTVELRFSSLDVYERVMRGMRLIEFALAYIEGKIEIIGDIRKAVDVLEPVYIFTDVRQTVVEVFGSVLFRFSKAVVPEKLRQFESMGHYAQSAQAYEFFLDEHMQYTCGYFPTGKEDIHEAQVAKFQFIQDLTGPLEGIRHLDIGCGWGGMMNYFEKKFGTHSLGNTNCRQQSNYAKMRYGSDIICGDFTELSYVGKRFDLVTVVGMLEHLTPHRQSILFKTIHSLLRDGGAVYLQCIAKPNFWVGGDAYRFTMREVFPGHYLEYSEILDERIRRNGFYIETSVEHALHYGLTTSRWLDNIQKNRDEVEALIGERRYRTFLGYFAMASKMFSNGRGNLRRYVLRKL